MLVSRGLRRRIGGDGVRSKNFSQSVELKLAHQKAVYTKEKAELIEEGFQVRKKQHADETALKVAALQAEIAKLQAAEYKEA